VWIAFGAITTCRRWLPAPALATPGSRGLLAGLSVLLTIWGVTTWQQTQHWRSTEALWTHTLAPDPVNPMALNNLGFHRLAQERYDDAIPLFRTALAIEPSRLEARLELEYSLEQIGDLDGALHVHRRGLLQHPDAPALHHNVGVVYHELGPRQQGEEHLTRAKALGFAG
jgi:tetratricopeptide (TPR) repeat protein